MSEREISRRPPGTAIVEVQNIPACATNFLGQVEVAFISGKTVQEHHGRVRACPRCHIDQSVEEAVMARNLETLQRSGIRRALRSQRPGKKDGGEDDQERARPLESCRPGHGLMVPQSTLQKSALCNHRVSGVKSQS